METLVERLIQNRVPADRHDHGVAVHEKPSARRRPLRFKTEPARKTSQNSTSNANHSSALISAGPPNEVHVVSQITGAVRWTSRNATANEENHSKPLKLLLKRCVIVF
jgi:hypothetical protein